MKKALLIILLFLVVQTALSFVLAMIGGVFNVSDLAQFQKMPTYYWCLGASLVITDLLLILLVYYVIAGDCKKPYTSYLIFPRGRDFWLSLPTFLCLMFAINGLTEMANVPDMLKTTFEGMTHNWLCILGVIIIGPISEEICFRRGILGSLLLSPRFHRYALVLSALIFGVIHLNPAQMGGAFVLGLFLGWLYIRTHSLVLPILFHILNNGLGILLSVVFGSDAKLVDTFPNTMSFYIALGVSIVAVCLLFRLMQKKMQVSNIVDDVEDKK